jgi:predicted DsbA family dithiol-disulfide isomerase
MDLTSEVFVDHMTATQTGIQGVPAVIVGRSQLVSGAQEVEVYRSVVDKVLSARGADGG